MSSSLPHERTPLTSNGSKEPESLMHQISELFFHPFSAGALKLLPKKGAGARSKSKRADRIPESGETTGYHTIPDSNIRIRIPKKIATPVRVESKVWFANERTFVSYLSMGMLLSTIASGLLFGAKDSPARYFALAYASISVGVLVYGWAVFQKRLTMISSRDAGQFDLLWGPLCICLAIFVAILANFIFRIQEARRETGANPLSFQNAWYQAGQKSSWMGK